MLGARLSSCPQLPTTLPTFDELLGRDGIGESTVADAVFRVSAGVPTDDLQVFTLHAELEGMRLLGAFESLLVRWRDAGAALTRMAGIYEHAIKRPLPHCRVILGEVAGRSGLLAVQAPRPATSA